MDGIEFIDAGIEMAPVIAALHRACFEQPWDRDAIAKLMQTPGYAAMLARTGESSPEPAGFILYRQAGDEAEILAIGVAPRHRRGNVASKLLRHVADTLRRRGIGALFLEVAAENEAALALYRRLNYQQIGQCKGDDTIDGGNALVLRRKLI